MEVFFLTCWYPSDKNPTKGIFILEHAKAIQQAGISPHLIAISVEDADVLLNVSYVREHVQGFPVFVIRVRSRLHKFIYINPLLLYFFLLRGIRKFSPDLPSRPSLVHSNVLSPCGLIGYWLSRKYRVPHILTEHWSKVGNFLNKNIFSSLGKKILRRSFAVTPVSNFLWEELKKNSSLQNNVTLIPNVVNTEIYQFRPKLRSEKEFIFTAVATWRPPKLPSLMVEALNRISQHITAPIILKFIGEGPQLDEIKQRTDLHKNLQICYLGYLPKDKIAETLYASDFLLHASSIETFGLAVAEALATGTPVVCSNVGALPSFIHSNNGVLCSNTPESWEEGILKAINTSYSHETISKEIHSQYNPLAIGECFIELYKKAAEPVNAMFSTSSILNSSDSDHS